MVSLSVAHPPLRKLLSMALRCPPIWPARPPGLRNRNQIVERCAAIRAIPRRRRKTTLLGTTLRSTINLNDYCSETCRHPCFLQYPLDPSLHPNRTILICLRTLQRWRCLAVWQLTLVVAFPGHLNRYWNLIGHPCWDWTTPRKN